MPRLSPGTLIVGVFAILFGLVGAYVVKRSLHGPLKPSLQSRSRWSNRSWCRSRRSTCPPAGASSKRM